MIKIKNNAKIKKKSAKEAGSGDQEGLGTSCVLNAAGSAPL